MIGHPNLKLWLPMSGNSSDLSASGANGTDVSMSYSATNAVFGQAAQFSGSGYIKDIGQLSDFSFIQNTGTFTIAFWMKLATLVGDVGIILNTSTSAEKGFYIYKGNNASYFYVDTQIGDGTGAKNKVAGASGSLDTNLHHWAIVFNYGVGNRVLRDDVNVTGTSTTSAALGTGNSTRKLCVGADPGAGYGAKFPSGCAAGNVQIYDYAMSDSDVKRIMQGLHPLARS